MRTNYLISSTFPSGFASPYVDIMGEASILGFIKTTVSPNVPFLVAGMTFPKVYDKLVLLPPDFQKQTFLTPIIGDRGGEFRTMTDIIGLCEGSAINHFEEIMSHHSNKVEECYLINRSTVLSKDLVPLVLPLLKVVLKTSELSVRILERIIYINPVIFTYPRAYPILYKYVVKKLIPFYNERSYLGNTLHHNFEYVTTDGGPLKIVMESSDFYSSALSGSIIQTNKWGIGVITDGKSIKESAESEPEMLDFEWLWTL